MPLDRTPPASPIPGNEEVDNKLDSVSTLRHHSSEPDIASLVAALNTTERKKRKRDGDPSMTTILKDLFLAFSKEQEKNFLDLKTVIDNLNEQNLELKKSVEVMSSKYDDFLEKITDLEFQRNEDKKKISFLEDRIDFLERKSRSAGIEIRNVPKQENETKANLCNLVTSLGKTVNIDINEDNIRDIYRVSKKDSSKPIIVELNSVLVKEKILKNVKNFNKSKKKGDKLNTSHLQFKQPANPVYVSETLTTKSQKLFYLARSFQKEYGFSFCWTSHGVVYLRKNENSVQIRINSEADLDKLKKSI